MQVQLAIGIMPTLQLFGFLFSTFVSLGTIATFPESLLSSVDALAVMHNPLRFSAQRQGWISTTAITPATSSSSSSSLTLLHMGKGFNKARNKQAELAKKMAIAKSQNSQKAEGDGTNDVDAGSNANNNDIDGSGSDANDADRDQDRKMREEFEKLLQTTSGSMPIGDDAESAFIPPIQAGSKLKKKIAPPKVAKPKKISAKQQQAQQEEKKLTQMQVQRRHFESLVDVETAAPLGAIGAAKLVPWVPPFLKTGLIVLVDPRSNSNDLRRAMKYQASSAAYKTNEISKSDKNNNQAADVIFVTADSVGETKAWLKRNKMDVVAAATNAAPLPSIRILTDPGMSFMTRYEIIGDTLDQRWSMTMLVFDTYGKIIRLVRDVEPSI